MQDLEFMEKKLEDLDKSMKRSNDKQLKIEHELCERVGHQLLKLFCLTLGLLAALIKYIIENENSLSVTYVPYLPWTGHSPYRGKERCPFRRLESC
jgi:obg-like ATPase 1